MGFIGGIPAADDVDPVARPSRLHRRDTPHHLKNKRITTTVDKDKVASIIAKVYYFVSFFSCTCWVCRSNLVRSFFKFSLIINFFFLVYSWKKSVQNVGFSVLMWKISAKNVCVCSLFFLIGLLVALKEQKIRFGLVLYPKFFWSVQGYSERLTYWKFIRNTCIKVFH